MSNTLLLVFSLISVVIVFSLFTVYMAKREKPELSPTKRLTFTALLTALAVVCNIFTIQTGVKYLVLSFVAIPCFVAGLLLGPLEGLAVGFLGDFIGALIHPLGPYMPIIGLASGLWGFIPGVIMHLGGNTYKEVVFKVIMSFAVCLFICTVFLNTYALYLLYGGGRTFWAYLIVRLPQQSIVTAVNCCLCVFLTVTVKRNPYIQKLFLL